MQKTICVDFDGVIADYSQGFQGREVFGEPLHGAGSSMGALKEDGWRVIIFTTRPNTPALREYLRENGIPYDYINENPDQPKGANPGKPIASVYLDDRAFRFKGWADFRYALDAMVKEKILESAASDDWQGLKLLLEPSQAPLILEGAITPDDDLLNEWWGKIWPQYEDEGYTKDEIRGYILSGNWDADHLRNDIAEHDAKYDDGPGIVLSDSAAEEAQTYAVKGIRNAPDFASLASWFASAFDNGPAGEFTGVSDAARNIDAVWSVANRLKTLRAIHDDENADIDDRLEATKEFNTIVIDYQIGLGNGAFIYKDTVTRLTGVDVSKLKMPIEGTVYGNMKLAAYRDEAQNVYARAGVAPQAALRRIKAANDEVTRATEELSAKVTPINQAWDSRRIAILDQNSYKEKQQEIKDVEAAFRARREELGKERPKDFSYAIGANQADYLRTYEEWSAKMQAIWDEQGDALGKIRDELRALYAAAEQEAGDINAETAPFLEEYKRFTDAQSAEIAAARADIGKIKEHVIAVSPVSQETAEQWFKDMVLIPKNMQANLKKRGYDMETLQRDMTEFHRLTGGRLPRISFETKGGGRAAAQPGIGVVYVAGDFPRQTLFHELAHILEDDERTRIIANSFLDQRTGRLEERKLKRLSELTGNPGYKSSEVAFPDSFVNPYVGKHYSDGATEVFSMGMQYFSSPEAMATLLEKDPDHFNFMLGYAATLPRIDKAKVEAQQKAMGEKKDALQTSEEFLKSIDKKIAKAGDFWTKENIGIINGYRNTFFAQYDGPDYHKEGVISRHQTWSVKGEKNIKRAIWIWIAAGKPMSGDFYIDNLVNDVFSRKKIEITGSFAKDPAIQGAL